MLSVGLGANLACQAREGLSKVSGERQVRTCRAGFLLGWMFIMCGPALALSIGWA